MTTRKHHHATIIMVIALIAPMLLTACGKSVSATIDDAQVTTRVKTALLNAPDVDAKRIEVDTVNGVVTLSGGVRNEAERDQAVTVARRISGVRDVKSTLQIQP